MRTFPLGCLRAAAVLFGAVGSLIACSSPKPEAKDPPPIVQTGPATKVVGPATKVAPPTPIAVKKVELGKTTWDPAWDKIVEDALPPSLLSYSVPRDVRRFCPRFYVLSTVDKRAFWAYFFQALAGAEAGLNPDSVARHTDPAMTEGDGVPGEVVRTEGLLQLSYQDARRYGCDFDLQADRGTAQKDPTRTILQPSNNLECGVKILTNQLIDQKKQILSPSAYWSTLRPGTFSYRIFARQMTNPPAACGLHTRATRTDEKVGAYARGSEK